MISCNFYINFFDGCPDDLKIENFQIPANLARSTQIFSLILMSWMRKIIICDFYINYFDGCPDDLKNGNFQIPANLVRSTLNFSLILMG